MKKPILTNLDINAYALSQGMLMMAHTMLTVYFTMFMTDYLKIPTLMIGTAMLVVKTIDFLINLCAGPIVEKTNMKQGKYVSWIRILRFTLFAGLIILMSDTTWLVKSPLIRILIVCVGYCLFHGSMDFNVTVRGALVPKMAGANMEDRRRLTTRQVQVGAATSIIASAITLPIITWFAPYFGESAGYTITTAIYATGFFICCTYFIRRVSRFDPPDPHAASRKTATIREMVNSIATNRQMIVLVLIYTFFGIGNEIYNGVTAYYFSVVTGNFSMLTIALTCRSIFAFLASLCVPALGRKIGKRGSLAVGMGLYACSMLGIWAFGLHSVWIMIVCMCLAQGGCYMYQSFGVNYYLDCGEYGYYRTGVDNRTIAAAVMNIPTKIGFAIGGALVGYGLAWAGYTGPDMVITEAFISRYMMLLGLIPALFMTVSVVLVLLGYKLTDKEAAFYAQANAEREERAAAGTDR